MSRQVNYPTNRYITISLRYSKSMQVNEPSIAAIIIEYLRVNTQRQLASAAILKSK